MSELPPAPSAKPIPIGRLLLGLALVLAGIGWLLDALDVVDVDWDLALPVALILVGVGVAASAWRGEGRGGLVALGVVLTVVLALGTVVRIPYGGSIGDATERPTSFRDRDYEHAVGQLTVDLSGLSWGGAGDPAEVTIDATLGLGQLVVIVPAGIPCVATHAEAGLGEVNVFGDSEGGIGPEYRPDDVCAAEPELRLELSVGIGQVEVRRG